MRFAFVAALLLLTAPAVAQERHHDGGPGIHFGVDRNGLDLRLGSHRDFHGRFIGIGRHFWHGQWYEYGIGPCWALGPDGYFWWICD